MAYPESLSVAIQPNDRTVVEGNAFSSPRRLLNIALSSNPKSLALIHSLLQK